MLEADNLYPGAFVARLGYPYVYGMVMRVFSTEKICRVAWLVHGRTVLCSECYFAELVTVTTSSGYSPLG
jgi:hypothetical protein